jgi:regulator of protease activity HflC (stomatin/prohibitin superfamily)
MNPKLVIAGVVALLLIMFGGRIFHVVPPGHVHVATLFGGVVDRPFEEGLHIVNPLYSWHSYDVRQKTHKETALVPTQDQLQTKVEVSVQYRLLRNQVSDILQNTGTTADVITVHLVPKLRSLVREAGKSIPKAEDFFLEETQDRLQILLEGKLREYLQPLGVEVQAVLIRDITLPPFITKAIEQKKEREQAVERQKAELERFRTEQQQKIAAAEAERRAAEEEAKRRRIQADARAYEIEQINKAVSRNPAYVQLQALEALREMSKDPAAKLYFMDSNAAQPLPLMHMGEGVK